ncbi:MAG: succinylglutamate desuccinylase/aspartoacylase family protein [Proteobacteria bacterium]|nr:succinylglutamate desuccinylase/aspartoacylase family protein [Pseudomonadota bacterium]
MAEDTVELVPPDIERYRRGNHDIDYVHEFDSGKPGPRVMVNALTHGNEICGAIALDRLLRLGVRPSRGRLTFAFVNVAAYGRFDAKTPHASRFVDEDLNRVWLEARLDGPENTVELRRARELRPLFDQVDFLLDIHSMQTTSPALMICHGLAKERKLARAVGVPPWIVCGSGHIQGRRLIEYTPFNSPDNAKTALLVECGQHWAKATATVASDTALRFLYATGVLARAAMEAHVSAVAVPQQRMIDVTDGYTAKTAEFSFVEPYIGLERIERAGTVVAEDGEVKVVTPYDDCYLVMPNHRAKKGERALRYARAST